MVVAVCRAVAEAPRNNNRKVQTLTELDSEVRFQVRGAPVRGRRGGCCGRELRPLVHTVAKRCGVRFGARGTCIVPSCLRLVPSSCTLKRLTKQHACACIDIGLAWLGPPSGVGVAGVRAHGCVWCLLTCLGCCRVVFVAMVQGVQSGVDLGLLTSSLVPTEAVR